MILYANAGGTIYGWRWGVNEGTLRTVSATGHKVIELVRREFASSSARVEQWAVCAYYST
jgi:hypothetical protein